MSTVRRVIIDFLSEEHAPKSLLELEEAVAQIKVAPGKVILVISRVEHRVDQHWVLPLIDSWLKLFPGRVFLDKPMSVPSVISDRVPVIGKTTVWQGFLHLGPDYLVPILFQEPMRFDRLPNSEDVYVLGSLSEDQLDMIPGISGKSVCRVSSDEPLHNVVLISPSVDCWTDSKLFLLTNGAVQSIQSPATFLSLYQTTVAAGKEDTYLRSLAMGPRLDKGPLLQALLTKKQVNILNTMALLEARVCPFFKTYKPIGVDSGPSNFENALPNKYIGKLANANQEAIESILTRCAGSTSFEEMMYKGKRQRRILGTMWNSHQWPNVSALESTDGLLLSEVVGSVFS